MNHQQLSNSARERFRSDFNMEFLRDLVEKGVHMGYDPRNFIGRYSGFNVWRAYDMYENKILSGGYNDA